MQTIRDVARLADVSLGTVSKVINKKGRVSAKLTERVVRAMEALDYQPDHVARSLKAKRTQTVGMVLPDITNAFFTDVIRGIESEARANGYSLILSDSNEDPAIEQLSLNTLLSRRVDGVLLAPTDVHIVQERAARRHVPLVLFDRVSPGYTGSAVVTDNLGASCDATRHLLELGHRRVAIITGRLNQSTGQDRLEGFRRALQQAGLPLREEYMRIGDFQFESGYQCGLALLRLHVPPTAIFCCNNQMTLGLMRALAEMHVSCPCQVSVLGFDDFPWAANFTPRLTTVAQPSVEMGKRAMEILLRKMQSLQEGSDTAEEGVVILKAELRVRDSTAPPESPGRTA